MFFLLKLFKKIAMIVFVVSCILLFVASKIPLNKIWDTILPDSLQNAAEKHVPSEPEMALKDIAQEALIEQFAIAAADIKFDQLEPRIWVDNCLGLPKPNELCTKKLTPGIRVTFKTPERVFAAHVAEGQKVRFEQ